MPATAPARPMGGAYDLPRPHGTCSVCGQPIPADQRFVAAVRETPQALQRLDLHEACWAASDRAGALGFWMATMPRPEAKKRLLVDDATLCEIFRRLGDSDEPAKQAFRFVLGLILMRKRLIAFEASRVEQGRESWSVRLRGDERAMDLFNPRLNEQQVAEVSQQIGQILSEELS